MLYGSLAESSDSARARREDIIYHLCLPSDDVETTVLFYNLLDAGSQCLGNA